MILNLHYAKRSTTNLAEYFTQPIDYFSWSEQTAKASLFSRVDELIRDASLLIIGGSGIHNEYTWLRLKEVVDQTPPHVPVVIWGMGINDHGRLDRNYHETLHDLERRPNVLIGLRDWFYRTHVPCVSCLRQEFDANFSTKFDVGFYVHKQFDVSLPCPTMSNKVEGNPTSYFWRVLRFLGSCEVVVTNTYHGAYWATLLNRRVIVVAPFSNKFLGLKHEPIIVQDAGLVRDVLRYAKTYPQALSECRSANLEFHRRVIAFGHHLATDHARRDSTTRSTTSAQSSTLR